MTQIGNILLTTFQAIVTVFVVYFAGYLLVKLEKVDQEGVKVLSQVANYCFIPALVLVRLGGGLSIEVLKYAYPLTLAGTGLTVYYFVLTKYVICPLAKPTKQFERWFILGQSVVNFVALPLILVSAICSKVSFTKPEFFLTEEEKDLNLSEFVFSEAECVETGELYIFMYSCVVTFLLFSVGWQYVSGSHQTETSLETHEKGSIDEPITDESTSLDLEVPEKKLSELKRSEQEQLEKTESIMSSQKAFYLQTKDLFLEMFIYRPVSLGQVIGIFIGLVAPIQSIFFNDDGSAPLDSITAGINVLGTAATPVINVIMACTLAVKLLALPDWTYLFGHEETLGVSRRTILVFSLGRMVIVPAITFAWLYFVVEATFPDDKLMKFLVLIELFVPTANMAVVMAQIMHQRENAETMAISMLLQYIIGMFSISIWTFLLIYLLDLDL